jgi:hypothetical protein
MAKKDVTKESEFKDEKTITYGENGANDQTTENKPDGLDDETGLTKDQFDAAKAALRKGKKVGTGGPVQGANLQTATTVGAFKDDAGELHKDTLPQENDDKMVNRYLQRGLQNGDIRSKDDSKSLYAERMVNEGKQFQSSKAVVNPFPATGTAYLNLLKQQGQFNAGNLGGTQAGGTQAGGTQAGGTQAGGTQAGGTQAGGTQAGGTQAGGTQADNQVNP